jgi:hypothetical protein
MKSPVRRYWRSAHVVADKFFAPLHGFDEIEEMVPSTVHSGIELAYTLPASSRIADSLNSAVHQNIAVHLMMH